MCLSRLIIVALNFVSESPNFSPLISECGSTLKSGPLEADVKTFSRSVLLSPPSEGGDNAS